MAESDERPVNLDLFSIRFPITAIASILHRISGVVLFFGSFVFMYLLDKSLVDEAGFGEVRMLIADPLISLVIWCFLVALGYHFIAGIKHMVMDFGYAETFEAGSRLSVLSIVLGIIVAILFGGWLWFPMF